MVPVDSDDLWYAYNLVAPGDSVLAVTVRYIFRNPCSQSFLKKLIVFFVDCQLVLS